MLVPSNHGIARVAGQAKSPDELRADAVRYGLDWNTIAQVNFRRGYLQSASLVRLTDSGAVGITEDGRALLSLLDVFLPDADEEPPEGKEESVSAVAVAVADKVESHGELERLTVELTEGPVDATKPGRFEVAVRDAFRFLGFAAEHLGKV